MRRFIISLSNIKGKSLSGYANNVGCSYISSRFAVRYSQDTRAVNGTLRDNIPAKGNGGALISVFMCVFESLDSVTIEFSGVITKENGYKYLKKSSGIFCHRNLFLIYPPLVRFYLDRILD